MAVFQQKIYYFMESSQILMKNDKYLFYPAKFLNITP